MSWVALLGLPVVRLCLVSAVPVWGDLSRGKTIPEDTDTCISTETWSCLQTESFGVGFFFTLWEKMLWKKSILKVVLQNSFDFGQRAGSDY